MADPIVIECASACTVTLEVKQVGPFSMSVEDGSILAFLIVLVWLAGAGWRWLMKAVSPSNDA